MIRFLALLFAIAVASPAMAQDARQMKFEWQALQALLSEQADKTAHAAAMYQIEKEDHAADKKALADLRAWVDAYFKP